MFKRLFVVRVAPGQDDVSQARERGVEAGAIGTVVLTHLHYDHAGAAGQLPNATFLFDGREWAPAIRGRLLEGDRRETIDRPLDWRAGLCRRHGRVGFSHALDLFGDGSVRHVSTPGHSPGRVSVVLRTASGPLLLAGDAAYTRRAIAEGHDQIARADLAAYRNPSRASGDGPMPTPPHPSSAATTTSYGPICPRSSVTKPPLARRCRTRVQSVEPKRTRTRPDGCRLPSADNDSPVRLEWGT